MKNIDLSSLIASAIFSVIGSDFNVSSIFLGIVFNSSMYFEYSESSILPNFFAKSKANIIIVTNCEMYALVLATAISGPAKV